MTHPSSSGHRRIEFLDLLRIFAFASVFVGHNFYLPLTKAAISPDLHVTVRLAASALMPLTHGGGAGVVVFFLISGYIITHVLRQESAAQFAVRRLFRIYPLYVLAVTIQTAGHYALRGEVELTTYLAQITLLGDFFDTDYALGGVEWTLRIEIMFYAFMAGLKAIGVLDGSLRRLPYALVAASAVLLWLAPIPTDTAPWATGYTTTYGHLLLLGALIYATEVSAPRRDVAAAIMVGLLAAYFYSIPLYTKLWMESHFAILAVGLFAALWAVRDRIAPPPYVRWVSDLTYSVYLFHAWAYHRIHEAVVSVGALQIVATPLALILFFAGCAAVLVVVERPMIALGRRMSLARR